MRQRGSAGAAWTLRRPKQRLPAGAIQSAVVSTAGISTAGAKLPPDAEPAKHDPSAQLFTTDESYRVATEFNEQVHSDSTEDDYHEINRVAAKYKSSHPYHGSTDKPQLGKSAYDGPDLHGEQIAANQFAPDQVAASRELFQVQCASQARLRETPSDEWIPYRHRSTAARSINTTDVSGNWASYRRTDDQRPPDGR